MTVQKTKFKILVTPTSFNAANDSDAMARLRAFTDDLVFNATGKPLAEADLIGLLTGCDGAIAGLDDYSGKALRACAGRLKAISRYGSGYDNVDLDAARECGVTVCCTPGANSQAVADLTFGLMLAVARRIPMLDRRTKAGEWTRSTGVELFGKTLGIVGLGAVGKNVAKRALGFSMRVLAYEPNPDGLFVQNNGILTTSLDALLGASDFISLHLPLNRDTRNILNREALALAKPGAIIINTARGGLVDEDAAYEMLVSGRLGGIGLDAYAEEPPSSSPLFGLDNVVLTPHTGSHTKEAAKNLADMSVSNLIETLSGLPCRNIVK